MTRRPARPRPGPSSRRLGYTIAVGVNVAMLYLINVAPGWEAVPFLTEETEQVLGLVNASIALTVGANVVYLAHDPRWVKGLGDALTTAFGVVVLARIWSVFPFDADGWEGALRVLLVLAIAGSVIGVGQGLSTFLRARPRASRDWRGHGPRPAHGR